MTTSIETEVVRYLDHLTVEQGLSEHTIAAYRRDLARYTRFLASRDVVDPAKVDEALVRRSWRRSAPAHTVTSGPTGRRRWPALCRRCDRSTGSWCARA